MNLRVSKYLEDKIKPTQLYLNVSVLATLVHEITE